MQAVSTLTFTSCPCLSFPLYKSLLVFRLLPTSFQRLDNKLLTTGLQSYIL